MLTLGLDTALQRCSVAIVRDGEILSDQAAGMERGHAEHLAPMAAAALAEAGVRVKDLDRIGVVVGPGGFTGVRVGLSFARGLAIGVEVPVVGVTSLAALAGNVADAPEAAPIAPVIDARRAQVYAALYDAGGAARIAPFVAAPEEALQILTDGAAGAETALVGTGAALFAETPPGWRRSAAPDQIDAKVVARLAAAAPVPPGPPAPLYLRPPDAKPLRAGLLTGRAGP